MQGVGVSSGWHSGASGPAAEDGTLGTWRGKPVQIIGTWSDTEADVQTSLPISDVNIHFQGDLDIAVGALAPGETWRQAAQGAYVDRWKTAVENLRRKRQASPGTTYVRFAHEMDGDWMDWFVNSGNVADFKTSWAMYRKILHDGFPQAKLVFSPGNDNHSDVPLSQMWPGDDQVDVVGVDFYDGWPDFTSQSVWDEQYLTTDDTGGPRGLGAWLAFAKQHGKPMALPEWGLRDADRPALIQSMHDFLAKNAAKPGDTDVSGKIIYDVYFNVLHDGNSRFLIYGGPNTTSEALYRSLTWGS